MLNEQCYGTELDMNELLLIERGNDELQESGSERWDEECFVMVLVEIKLD